MDDFLPLECSAGTLVLLHVSAGVWGVCGGVGSVSTVGVRFIFPSARVDKHNCVDGGVGSVSTEVGGPDTHLDRVWHMAANDTRGPEGALVLSMRGGWV